MRETGQSVRLEDEYIELFDENLKHLNNGSSDVVNQARKEAIENFKKLGIPTTKVENYKYTNLQPNFEGSFIRDFNHELFQSELSDVFHCEVPELNTYNVFIINGWYYRRNEIEDLPEGVEIGSFQEMMKVHPELAAKYYGKAALTEGDGTVALNTAFVQDGVFIYIPKGVVLERPVQVVNIFTSEEDLMINQRNLIIVEENAQAKVMVCDHTLTSHKFVANTVTEVFAERNSVFDMYNLQNQHNLTTQIASTYIVQKAYSNVLTNNLTLHAGTARNNISARLDEEYCENHMFGLYLCDKNQHVDNFTSIDHVSANCTSNEMFKGVLDDRASAAFTGRINVHKDAQKTQAFQRNNNILLTQDAKISTKPQLEIYADDVKCSHGATVGQLDESALFYLRARGVGEREARVLLMYAFAYEVIDKIRVEPLKEQIKELVEKTFRGELNKCHSCVVCGQLGTSVTCL